MNKSLKVHYMNKYPGARVDVTENSLSVYGADGEHKVQLEKNAFGQMIDVSEQMGCSDKHDLSPLPKNCRAWKLHKDGKIGKSEEYDRRAPWAAQVAEANGGMVMGYDGRGEDGELDGSNGHALAQADDDSKIVAGEMDEEKKERLFSKKKKKIRA